MSMSGIKMSEDLNILISEGFKTKSNPTEEDVLVKLAIIRLNDKNNAYVLDKVILDKEKIPGFFMKLSKYISEQDYRDTPCWVLFKTEMKAEEKLQEKVFCVYWCPDSGPITKKMPMSASTAPFKAISTLKYKECHDPEDWCVHNFLSAFSGKATMVDGIPVRQRGKDYITPEEFDEILQQPLNIVCGSEYMALRHPTGCKNAK